MEYAYGSWRPVPGDNYASMDPNVKKYWNYEAAYYALEVRRHGSLYRKSLRLSWWRKLWLEFTQLPEITP